MLKGNPFGCVLCQHAVKCLIEPVCLKLMYLSRFEINSLSKTSKFEILGMVVAAELTKSLAVRIFVISLSEWSLRRCQLLHWQDAIPSSKMVLGGKCHRYQAKRRPLLKTCMNSD